MGVHVGGQPARRPPPGLRWVAENVTPPAKIRRIVRIGRPTSVSAGSTGSAAEPLGRSRAWLRVQPSLGAINLGCAVRDCDSRAWLIGANTLELSGCAKPGGEAGMPRARAGSHGLPAASMPLVGQP